MDKQLREAIATINSIEAIINKSTVGTTIHLKQKPVMRSRLYQPTIDDLDSDNPPSGSGLSNTKEDKTINQQRIAAGFNPIPYMRNCRCVMNPVLPKEKGGTDG